MRPGPAPARSGIGDARPSSPQAPATHPGDLCQAWRGSARARSPVAPNTTTSFLSPMRERSAASEAWGPGDAWGRRWGHGSLLGRFRACTAWAQPAPDPQTPTSPKVARGPRNLHAAAGAGNCRAGTKHPGPCGRVHRRRGGWGSTGRICEKTNPTRSSTDAVAKPPPSRRSCEKVPRPHRFGTPSVRILTPRGDDPLHPVGRDRWFLPARSGRGVRPRSADPSLLRKTRFAELRALRSARTEPPGGRLAVRPAEAKNKKQKTRGLISHEHLNLQIWGVALKIIK